MAKNTTKHEPKIETIKPEETLATPAAEAAARADHGDGDGSIPGDTPSNDFASLIKETESAPSDSFKGIGVAPETGLYSDSHGHVIAFSVRQRFDQDAMPQEVVYPQCGGVKNCDVCALHERLREDISIGRRGRTQAPWRAPSGAVVGPGDVASAMALIDAYDRFISDQMAPKMSSPKYAFEGVVRMVGDLLRFIDDRAVVARSQAHQDLLAAARQMLSHHRLPADDRLVIEAVRVLRSQAEAIEKEDLGAANDISDMVAALFRSNCESTAQGNAGLVADMRRVADQLEREGGWLFV